MDTDTTEAAARATQEGRREQHCPDCGTREAGGAYCTKCRRPVHPDEWVVSESHRRTRR